MLKIRLKTEAVKMNINFDHWDTTYLTQYGTAENGYFQINMEKLIAEGGPGMNDSYSGDSFAISVSDKKFMCLHKGFLVTNDKNIRDKVHGYYFQKDGIKHIDYLVKNNQLQEALPLLEKKEVKEYIEKDIKFEFYHGVALASSGSHEKAKPILESVIKKDPKHYDALYNLGQIYLNQKDYKKAIELMTNALKVDPENHVILYFTAQTYEKLEEKSESKKYYELAIKHAPENLPYGIQGAKSYLKDAEERLKVLFE